MSIMLITLAELREFLEIPSSNSDSDSLLVSLITNVSARIQTYLNRRLTEGYYSKYCNAGRKKYWVDAYPISTSAGITVTYNDTIGDINDDYYVWEDEGLIEFDFWTSYTEPKDIHLEWFGGYPTTITANTSSTTTITYTDSILLHSIPDDLKFACLLQAAYVYRRRRDIGLSSVDSHDGKYEVKGSMELIREVKSILNSYRKPAAGK